LQETFITAQLKIGQFRGEGKLRNWLFRIAGNSCRQRYRKNKNRLTRELRLDDVLPSQIDVLATSGSSWPSDPAEIMLSSELMERLEDAIAKTPPTNRSVLILRDVEGLSTRETARALEISEEAVKVRLHRARAFVRKQLKDYIDGTG